MPAGQSQVTSPRLMCTTNSKCEQISECLDLVCSLATWSAQCNSMIIELSNHGSNYLERILLHFCKFISKIYECPSFIHNEQTQRLFCCVCLGQARVHKLCESMQSLLVIDSKSIMIVRAGASPVVVLAPVNNEKL